MAYLDLGSCASLSTVTTLPPALSHLQHNLIGSSDYNNEAWATANQQRKLCLHSSHGQLSCTQWTEGHQILERRYVYVSKVS